MQHLESCAACAAYAAEVQSAVSFMEIAADVEPPPELTAKILRATNEGWEFKLRARGIRGWINRTFAPVLKPRFVMGAMLTMMSITFLGRCGNDPKKPLTGGGSRSGKTLVVPRRPYPPAVGPLGQELRKYAAGLRNQEPAERMERAAGGSGRSGRRFPRQQPKAGQRGQTGKNIVSVKPGESTMNCANHPEVAATAFCRECGQPMCLDCQRPALGSVYCAEHLPVPVSSFGASNTGATAPPPRRPASRLQLLRDRRTPRRSPHPPMWRTPRRTRCWP